MGSPPTLTMTIQNGETNTKSFSVDSFGLFIRMGDAFMGDLGDTFRDWGAFKKALRAKWGVNCPKCQTERPRACPSILLPQQRCKVDKYQDPRPRLTEEQKKQACKEFNAPYWEHVFDQPFIENK
jgi:hypothetical protein